MIFEKPKPMRWDIVLVLVIQAVICYAAIACMYKEMIHWRQMNEACEVLRGH